MGYGTSAELVKPMWVLIWVTKAGVLYIDKHFQIVKIHEDSVQSILIFLTIHGWTKKILKALLISTFCRHFLNNKSDILAQSINYVW